MRIHPSTRPLVVSSLVKHRKRAVGWKFIPGWCGGVGGGGGGPGGGGGGGGGGGRLTLVES